MLSAATVMTLSGASGDGVPFDNLTTNAQCSGFFYCKSACQDEDSLKKHINMCGVKSDGSQLCSGSLQSDIAFTKYLTKPYQCSRCGRGYRMNQSLKRHRWKCDQSRPLSCSFCSEVFYRADSLQRHIKCFHGFFLQ